MHRMLIHHKHCCRTTTWTAIQMSPVLKAYMLFRTHIFFISSLWNWMVSLTLSTFSTLIKLEGRYFFPPKDKPKMATPAKLPKTDISEFFDVEGYVHSVTPTKLSVKTNASYYNFILQTDRTTFTDVVSYSPENRRYLLQASEKKNPIKITNVKRALSKFFNFIIYPYNING